VLVVRSPIGRAWTAIRDDETAAAASGVNVTKYMRQAFVLNGAIAALGGVMMAMQSRYIAPDNVNLFSNILVLLAVVIGGQGSNIGVLLGSVALIVIGQVISGLQDFPTLIYGLILFVVMRFLPRGLWPHLRSAVTWIVDRIRRPGIPTTEATAPADEPTLVGVEQ
jgi:branched-chain amino acid transport system permease protein